MDKQTFLGESYQARYNREIRGECATDEQELRTVFFGDKGLKGSVKIKKSNNFSKKPMLYTDEDGQILTFRFCADFTLKHFAILCFGSSLIVGSRSYIITGIHVGKGLYQGIFAGEGVGAVKLSMGWGGVRR